MRQPNFIGLGAQKAGTSWLAACLAAHPQIYMPRKETQFFTHKWDKGLEWYESLFAKCPPGQICGEFSTSYLCSEDALVRIKRVAPDAKLIAVLRHPVERALALVRHKMMRGKPYGTEAVIGWSRYSEYVPQWQEKFGEQLWLVDYNKMQRWPLMFIITAYEWLSVDRDFIPSLINERVNVSINPKSVWAAHILDSLGHLRTQVPFKWFWWTVWCARWRNSVKYWNHKGEFQVPNAQVQEIEDALKEEVILYENWLHLPPIR